MKEKLQILEEQIRKALPRLLEPKEGCYLRKINDDRPLKIIAEQHSTYFIYDLRDRAVFSKIKFKNLYDEYQIIGHDILLSDVLEWLKIRQLFIDDIYVDFDGYFGLLDMSYEKFKCFKVHWNLSKPYLKEQSEELIDFLYNLIKK